MYTHLFCKQLEEMICRSLSTPEYCQYRGVWLKNNVKAKHIFDIIDFNVCHIWSLPQGHSCIHDDLLAELGVIIENVI